MVEWLTPYDLAISVKSFAGIASAVGLPQSGTFSLGLSRSASRAP
jgi:hypothetical protein